jgi:transmembrane sensor
MHYVHAMNARAVMDVGQARFDRTTALEAAQWFVLFESGEATERDRAKFAQWRADNTEHERAWQRATHIGQRTNMIPADIGRATLNRSVRVNRRQAMGALALLIMAVPAGFAAYRAIPRDNHYRTATGEQRRITLADGTQLQLNTDSEVRIVFDEGQRLIQLAQGEIWIETAKDPLLALHGASRPLSVQTSHGAVRALGTRFVVRQEDKHTHVTVFEGAVAIRPQHGAGDEQRIDAGQQTSFSRDVVDAATPASAAASLWTRGILSVEDMRLDQFAAELARYRSGIVRCDPAVGSLRITGAFQINNTDAALSNVALLLPVDIVYRSRYWTTIVPRAEAQK